MEKKTVQFPDKICQAKGLELGFLTADLGVPRRKIPQWHGDDFDTVYAVTLDASTGAYLSFDVGAQNYAPKSTTCPADYVPPPGEPGYTSPEEEAFGGRLVEEQDEAAA